MHTAVGDLFKTSTFWSGVLGWTAASVCKILIDLRVTGRLDFRYLASLGGMPSAHSALVSAVATSVGLVEGFGSTIFVVSLAFAIVVMFDASTVRRATGLQARLLNRIVDEMHQEHRLSPHRLKEILGHTRTEVFVGMLIGIAIAVIVNAFMK